MKLSKLLQLIFLSFVFVFVFLSSQKLAYASEGTAKIRSVTNEDYRCFLSSLQNEKFVYKILVSCRNLLYPNNSGTYSYILWAQGADKPFKLGPLGLGKAQFETKKPFTNLFVTTEANVGIKAPSKGIVMRGTIERISFLDNPTKATPTPTKIPGEKVQESNQSSKLATALKRVGLVIALITLLIIISFLIILVRSKR